MKATIKPPKEGLVANVQRKSNPFVSDPKPDWVPNPSAMEKAPDAAAGRKPVPPTPPPRQRTVDEADAVGPDSSTDMRNSPPAVPRKPLSLSSQTALRGPVRLSSHVQHDASVQLGSVSDPTASAKGASTDLLGDVTGEQIEWKPLLPDL